MSQDQQFAIMWDCNGLEALEAIPEPEEITFALLQSIPPPWTPSLMHWELRARYNSQRHYEIYIFSVAPGVEKKDILDMFKQDPQSAADTIRRLGHCYYSDRVNEEKVVIR